MKKKIYISLAGIFTLLLPFAAYAADKSSGGEIELTPTYADINGNEAKFNEYRDIDDGLYGTLRLWQESGSFFINLEADDILYDTQSYLVDGGTYGKYKFNLFYNEIPHNLTFDAKTPLTGAGGASLTYSGAGSLNAASPAVSTWNTFDYATERKQGGGGIRFDMLKPYYIDFSVSQEVRDGIKPTGTSWNSVAGGGSRRVLEMPEPVDYVTNNLKTEIGYSLNPFFGAVSLAYSQFNNNNNNLFYEHPNSGSTEALSLPPDNEYYNLDFKGRALLPHRSSVSVQAARGVSETSTVLRQQYLSDIGVDTAIGLSDAIFDGKVETTSYDITVTSSPVSFADGRLFYKYYEKDNKSDQITFDNSYSNHLFSYDKETIGASVDFQLPASVTLSPSYQHLQTDRHRGDFPETTDNMYAIDAKWQGLDFMMINIGYEMLDRSSAWQQLTSVDPGDQANANLIEPYIRRFDAAPQERDTYSITLDISPLDNLNIGLGYQHRFADYTDTDAILGLRDDKSNTYNLSADYVLGIASLAGYFSYEKSESFQFQRRFTSAANANPQLGNVGPNTHYNWSLYEKTENSDYGISAAVDVVPNKWRVKAQYDHVRSNGFGDFTLHDEATTGTYTNETLDIQNLDDYKKSSFLVKAIYNVNEKITTTVGYAFERYYYSDAQLDEYDYKINSTDYLSGAFIDQTFEANVVFCNLKYAF